MPAVRPAWLRSWQGKPAATSSTSGSSSSVRMSPMERDAREALLEHGPRRRVDLAERDRLEAGGV